MGGINGRDRVESIVLGRNKQVGSDMTAAWANSAVAGTVVNNDVAQPNAINTKHFVTIHNPSAETALTVSVQNIHSLGGATRYAEVRSIAVPIGETVTTLIEGLFRGTGGVRLAASNDAAVGLTGAFTADLSIREA